MIALIACYATNLYEPTFFESLSKVISEMTNYDIIIGGNMNAVINPLLDRSRNTQSNSSANLALSTIINNYALVDIWRVRHPISKELTFFSKRHLTFSRIDYIFISSKLVDLVQNTEISHMSISDHHANVCKKCFSQENNRAARWRFNLTLLQDSQYCQQLKIGLREFMLYN